MKNYKMVVAQIEISESRTEIITFHKVMDEYFISHNDSGHAVGYAIDPELKVCFLDPWVVDWMPTPKFKFKIIELK